MSHLIRKSHNVSIPVYHFVCPVKYRRAVVDEKVDQVLKEVRLDIADRYQVEFVEIGTDKDHAHFLVQSVPTYNPTKIIMMIKSLTAREIFMRVSAVKRQLGQRILDRWLLCWNGRAKCNEKSNQAAYSKSRTRTRV